MMRPAPMNHIGITVSDIDAAIGFYTKVLGYRLFTGPLLLSAKENPTGQLVNLFGPDFKSLKIAHLSTGSGPGLEIFQPIDPPYQPPTDAVPYRRAGTTHICVTDPDIEGICELIKAEGGQQLSEIWSDRLPHKEFKMVYCLDPWGTLLEVHTHDYLWVQGWRSPV